MAEFSCPLERQRVLDLYFMEHRAKLLDIAAFLDRVDRARPGPVAQDFRLKAFHAAVGVLAEPGPDRTRRIQELLSDPTTTPLASASGLKGAHGAWPGTHAP